MGRASPRWARVPGRSRPHRRNPSATRASSPEPLEDSSGTGRAVRMNRDTIDAGAEGDSVWETTSHLQQDTFRTAERSLLGITTTNARNAYDTFMSKFYR